MSKTVNLFECNFKCDLNLTNMHCSCTNTLSCHGEYLFQVISKYPYVWPCFSLDMKCWCLILTNDLKCDLDIWPTGMVLVSSHCLPKVDMYAKLFLNTPMHDKVSLDIWPTTLSVTLTFDLQTWLLHTSHHLALVITCAK